MTDGRRPVLRDEQLASVARAIDPRSRVLSCAPMVGGLDAKTFELELDVAGDRRALVLRISTWEKDSSGARARRYWNAISGIPATFGLAPRPVLLDAEGRLLGFPAIVMTRLPGAPRPHPLDPAGSINELASALAAMHAVDDTSLPSEYRRAPEIGERVEARLRGAATAGGDSRFAPAAGRALWGEVETALRSAARPGRLNGQVLSHHDFWFANLVWTDQRLTGIVDWDGAQIDDPGLDFGYARVDLQVMLGGDAADRLRVTYETRRPPIGNVPFWDLMAVLPMFRWLPEWLSIYRDLGGELSEELARSRVESFVRSALSELRL